MSSTNITYTICFCDSVEHFFKPVLETGFAHCFAIKHTDDYYVVINCDPSHVEVDVLPATDEVFNDLVEDMVYLTLTIEVGSNSIAGLRWLSCVESVKSLLGIRSFFMFTPYQLYRYLKCQVKVQPNVQLKTSAD